MTTTNWVRVDNPDALWAEAERRATCTCGLLAVGYRGSWAISHAERCHVTEVYRTLVLREGAKR